MNVAKCVKARMDRLVAHNGDIALLYLGSVATVLICIAPPGMAGTTVPTVRLTPGQDVSAAVGQAPAGATFVFSPGTYRMQSIVPKANDSFSGDGEVVLNGAKLIEMQPEGRRWSSVVPRSVWIYAKGNCDRGHPLCWVLSDLFIDNQVQAPVTTLQELGPGRWFYDDESGKMFISTNPAGHRIEFGSTAAAFSGPSTGVRISHIIVEKYASPPEYGAIGAKNGTAHGWTVLDTETRWNHGAGIAIGTGSRVERCSTHHNGESGMSGQGANITVQSTEIAYNNYAGFDNDWGGGGAKFSGTDGLVLRLNFVHDNLGDGLWTDIDNIHSLYEMNRSINNRRVGLHHEISYDAIIRDNVVTGNPLGIQVVLSPNVEVVGNTIEVPVKGIAGIIIATGQRGVGKYGPHLSRDDSVHDNVITYLGATARSGASGPCVEGANIRFDANRYDVAGGEEAHWLWGSASLTLPDAHRLGIETHAIVNKKGSIGKPQRP
jgi:Right handed beta helix region